MDYSISKALIDGIINAANQTKQELGQRFADHLGLEHGPLGPDGGIDGSGSVNGQEIYFQSKLSKQPLGTPLAKELHDNLIRYQADIGVVLAGVGYTKWFEPRLQEFHDIDKFKIHLLTLHDYFNDTLAFQAALEDLPPLRDLGIEKWQE